MRQRHIGYEEPTTYALELGMKRFLLYVGYFFVASALLVFLGNLTGWFPTFPYAGAALGMVGSSLIARGLGVRQRHTSATEERGYSVITLVFLASLMAVSWIWVAGAIDQPNASTVFIGVAVTIFINAVFVFVFAKAVAIARAKRAPTPQQPTIDGMRGS
jgi:hypothetical protein